ncbi:MAG: response regulator [Candidatus Contendobacter sp.]|nr:response regulator [Candidatus Contendobacter sp.]
MPVRHVLVVDDSKSARLMLRKMLQGFGLTVDMAESAEDALNYLRDQRPDAIFMDHTMPGMDGLTAVRQIRNDPATAAIPIAMYTSKDDPGYQMQARSAGAIGVLTKPAMPDVLGVTLERMHQAFDTASISSAALVAPAAGITVEQVEKLALEKAEMVFYEAIESQVLPLINDVIAKLRRDFDTSQEPMIARIAARTCEAQLAEWRPPEPPPPEAPPLEDPGAVWTRLAPYMAEQLKIFRREERVALEKLARETAAQICQSQLHELSGRLVQQLSNRYAEAVQKAGAVAREAAGQVAREAALQAISEATAIRSGERDAAVVIEQTARQDWSHGQRELKQLIYLIGGGAAAIGLGAALLAYVAR